MITSTTSSTSSSALVTPPPPSSTPPRHVPVGRRLNLRLHTTWGDPHFLGLTAVEILTCAPRSSSSSSTCYCATSHEVDGWFPKRLEVHQEQLFASPKDLNVCGHSGDPRTLDKLVNGINATRDDRNMWLVPYTRNGEHLLSFDLGQSDVPIAGIKIWNYNKSQDDAHRGARLVTMDVDGTKLFERNGWNGQCISSSVETFMEIRKAPGHVDYDSGQIIWLSKHSGEATTTAMTTTMATTMTRCSSQLINRGLFRYFRPSSLQTYETVTLPRGRSFKISLTSTWGDPYYIGLDRIEMYDQEDRLILIQGETVSGDSGGEEEGGGNSCDTNLGTISASPHSVNSLLPENAALVLQAQKESIPIRSNKFIIHDSRVPSNLFQPEQSGKASQCWLAPLRSSLNKDDMEPNVLYITFDRPTTLSRLKLFNYSKTRNRGAYFLFLSLLPSTKQSNM